MMHLADYGRVPVEGSVAGCSRLQSSPTSAFHLQVSYLQTLSTAKLFSVGEIGMNMEQWWDYADRGKPTYWEKNLFHCQYVHQKSHIDGTSAVRRRHLNTEPWQGRDVLCFTSVSQSRCQTDTSNNSQHLLSDPHRLMSLDKNLRNAYVINDYTRYDGSDCDCPRCDSV
jgi:hypothetical protein